MAHPRHPVRPQGNLSLDLSSERADGGIEVEISNVVFRAPDGEFVVAHAQRTRTNDELVLVGPLGDISIGETLRVRGRIEEHARHGVQLRVESFSPVMPGTAAGIARYLGSGLVPGIGKALAQRLVERFGDQTLEVIATRTDALREVPGIGKRRSEAIGAAVRSRRELAETLSFLHGLGLGRANARRIHERYGVDAVRVLRADPYLVAEEVRGIGFRTADSAGRALGIGVDDPRRAAGAVLHLLGKAADEGHAFCPEELLVHEALELEIPSTRTLGVLPGLARAGLILREDAAVYPPPLFDAEVAVARDLRSLARPRPQLRAAARARVEGRDEALSETQQLAVDASLDHGLLLLTGGPGTGKTTTVGALVATQEAAGRRVALCAPTGRAAKRLSEATGREAKTIHRLLEWNTATGGFRRGPENPIAADVVLVDEASMLDLRLAQSLFQAIAPEAHLVLVGDRDQLPPVGAGQVLRDALASGVGETVRLTQVFRQAEQSAIVRGAHAILHGDMPTPTPTGEQGSGDLFVIKAVDPDDARQKLVRLLARMEGAYGLDSRRDVHVLSPMRRGPLGVVALNELLQEQLNPRGAHGPRGIRVGDKVMQLRNDYEREVFNGDVGEVARFEGTTTYVRFDGREVRFVGDALGALSLAYASTVHKVQGSEFPAVVIVLHGAHHMLLTRALLYTAVTRGKRLVVLLGDPRAMARAARNAASQETRSRLLERLRGERPLARPAERREDA